MPENSVDVMRLCREKIRRAKPQLELYLATALKENKRCFCRYISNKRRAKENLHLLLVAEVNAVTKDEGKAKVFTAHSASVFIVRLLWIPSSRTESSFYPVSFMRAPGFLLKCRLSWPILAW